MTSPYQIQVIERAEKALERILVQDRHRIARKIDGLADDPPPAGARQLQGTGGLYRIRIGSYRAIYEIRDSVLLVLVIEIGHRRNVYRSY